jgi:hypothetical protein
MNATETREIAMKERIKQFEHEIAKERNQGNGYYETNISYMNPPRFFERFDRVKHLSPTIVNALVCLEDMGFKITFRHFNEPNDITLIISW